ncbi:MAG: cupin domain-containing protein [Candidatus Methanofastidiosa archaeon]|nr:cupin domain-containing protein [Candidatus Methanofastidiosa archaeon]
MGKIIKEQRPWGYYKVLYSDSYCKIKLLFISPNKNISYQYHHNREEHWTITQGNGKFISRDKILFLAVGDKIKINKKQKHTIKNTGNEILIIHEVQLGISFEESDIVKEALPISL